MKKFIRNHFNTLLIVGTFIIILGIGIGNNELSNVWRALGRLSFPWLALCAGVFTLHLGLDALTLHYLLRRWQHPITLRYALYVALMGLYYADVTPGISGGQPMQVYYLKKRDVPIGVSSSALTVKFFCSQLMLLVLGGLAWILNRGFVAEQLATNLWILVTGYVFNSLSVILVLLMAINKHMVRFLIALSIRIGHKLHICKDVERSTVKWEAILSSFHASVTLVFKRPGELLVLLLTSGFQVLALMLITVCLYFAFGLTGTRVELLVTIATLLFISAAYTPLPGGSGVQEVGFILYYKGIFPADTIFSALLTWRFFTFYANLIGGASATIFYGAFERYREKRKAGAPIQMPGHVVEKEAAPLKKEADSAHRQK
jgi:uncharacterized protein (TIRG00374 family)